MSKGGKYLNTSNQKPKKKGRKIVLIVICVLLVAVIGALAIGAGALNSVLDKIKKAEVIEQTVEMNEEIENLMGIMEETEPTVPTTEAVEETTTAPTVDPNKEPDILNVLVTGQSYRAGEDSRLADTNILVTINKDTKVVTITSFMRDTYVKLPDYMGHTCGWNRINTAYALGYTWGGTGGAMEMTNLCLKNNFGIEVDHNVEIDFTAFIKIIDILGGVRIDLTEAEAKYLNEHKYDWQEEVAAGENRLFGDYALSYARMRKAEGDAESDIKRTARQRTLIEAIFNKLKTKGLSVVQEMANEILPMVTTNMTNAEITSCMLELLPLLPELTIEKGTCPAETTYWPEYKELPDGGAYVLVFASEQQKRLMMPITEGITFD